MNFPFPKLYQLFTQSLLPYYCLLCKRQSGRRLELCCACEQELPWLHQACSGCARPLPAGSQNISRCGACLRKPPPYQQITSLFAYQHPISQLIMGMKFKHQLAYAHLLGQLMAQRFSARAPGLPKPDCLIPMPLHPRRLRERGYNQVLELVRPLANTLGIIPNYTACQRVRYTLPQSLVAAQDRPRNVRQAFAITKGFRARHVVLVDDVVTSGSTVIELSRLLRKHAEYVEIWCCARAG